MSLYLEFISDNRDLILIDGLDTFFHEVSVTFNNSVIEFTLVGFPLLIIPA